MCDQIVRGKVSAAVELGAKLSVSVKRLCICKKACAGCINENGKLIGSLKRHKTKYGFYTEEILAYKIYRTRENRDYCKSKGIWLSIPKLARPYNEEKKRQSSKHIKIHVNEMKLKANLEQAKGNNTGLYHGKV